MLGDEVDDVAAADLEVAALVYATADRQHEGIRDRNAHDCPTLNLLRHRRHCDG